MHAPLPSTCTVGVVAQPTAATRMSRLARKILGEFLFAIIFMSFRKKKKGRGNRNRKHKKVTARW